MYSGPSGATAAEHVLLRFLRRVLEIHRRRRAARTDRSSAAGRRPSSACAASDSDGTPAGCGSRRRSGACRPTPECSGRRAPSRAPTEYLRALAKNSTFWTSPFMRRAERPAEAAERLEERRHHLLAIGAVGQRAQVVERRLIELAPSAVAQRDRRVGKVGVREDAEDVRRRLPASGPASARIFSSDSVSVCARAPGDVVEVEPIDLQPRLGRDELLERSPCRRAESPAR